MYISELISENHNLQIKHIKGLWDCLQFVIGTEHDVEIRRVVHKLVEEVKWVSQLERDYIMGSTGEGFAFPWRDLDIMVSVLTCNVITESKEHKNTKSEVIHVASDADCQPGFCQLIPYSRRYTINKVDDMCFSRISFTKDKLKYRTNKNPDTRIHGPCIRSDSPIGFDMCYTLPIDPISSNEFLKEFQTKFWNNVKEEVLEKNITVMHVAPKSPPEGDTKGFQWLKSFAVLEQRIVHSLNHVQFCCYGLLKILLHYSIDADQEINDTLCSYHLKTVLFHVLEDIHLDFWIPSNILYCFWICLTRLLLFVKKGMCPNYFLPKSNLFLKAGLLARKGKIEKKILHVLQSGAPYLWSIIIQLGFRDSGMLGLQGTCMLHGKLKRFITLSGSLKNMKGHQTTYHQCMFSILKLMNLLQNENNDIKRAVLNHMFSDVMRRVGLILYEKFVLTGFTKYLLTAEAAFNLVQHSSSSNILYLATLWYCEGKFKQSIKVLKELLAVIYPSRHTCMIRRELSCSFSYLIRNYEYRLVYLDRGSSFLPKALEMYVNKFEISDFSMYDKSYALFLIFLSYLAVGKKKKCRKTLYNLQKSINDAHFLVFVNDPFVEKNSKTLVSVAENMMKELC